MTTQMQLMINAIPVVLSTEPSEQEIQRAAEQWAFEAFSAPSPQTPRMSLDAVSLVFDKLADDAERLIREQLASHYNRLH